MIYATSQINSPILAMDCLYTADYHDVQGHMFEEGLAVARHLGNHREIALMQLLLGVLAIQFRDPQLAVEHLTRSQ